MAGVHTEVHLEDEITGYLTAEGRGWFSGTSEGYDKALALYPDDVIGWIRDSQPAYYEKIKATHNGATDGVILDRLKKSIEANGTLHVLRKGFKHVGVPGDIRMCVFKPDSTRNPDEMALYEKVRLRVVRQVHYSQSKPALSIDLVFFINGIPVATSELKTEFTQDVNAAVRQYKTERLPKDPVTKLAEPLLTPKRGAIVHFAVSDEEIYMTTALAGADTHFLPFNMGDEGAAGNPINPSGGAKTSYFWDRILERETWLDIMGRFVHIEKKEVTREDGRKENRETTVFPRFHQWDAVTKLTTSARDEGAGHNYLIQHSAGSGKSNSIMWLAHRLSSLHDDHDKKVFDLVLVLTDRNVLDVQLQATIAGYAHAAGHVWTIDSKEGAKSKKLAEALNDSQGIVIVTLQTFPYVVQQLEDNAKLAKRTYAIIADEAHSSQTGEDAKAIREILGISDDEPETIVDAEDVLTARMAKRATPKNMSYFAFTATPKAKTIEIFGTPGPDGKKHPFHVYTMQQAIQEGFILDILQNYTTYKFAYKLSQSDPKIGDKIVPKSETAKALFQSAKLHPTNIGKHVEIIVEHFRENVQHLLNGKAKAMVVCESRKAAVKYKLAMDEYISKHGYGDLKTLVAFSGEVTDPNEFPEKSFTEAKMNGISSAAIPKAFGEGGYQVLLVAEKFQTGFDQPLLSAMYVHKRLSGIAAVQTLSRLNRTYKRGNVEKTTTFVLDFVNEADEILASFKPYYKDAYLTENADPNQLLDVQSKLDATHVYDATDIDLYVEIFLKAQDPKTGPMHTKLKGALDPVVRKYNDWVAKAKESKNDEDIEQTAIFRKSMIEFVRAYNFLSQIHNYGDTEVEKRAIFYSGLSRLIHQDRDEALADASGVVVTHLSNRKTFEGKISLSDGDDGGLKPLSAIGTAKARQKQYGPLAEIIELLNELFGADVMEEDKIALVLPFDEIMTSNETVRAQAANNDLEQFLYASNFPDSLDNALLEAQDSVSDQNLRQNDAVKTIVERFFADKDVLDRFKRAYGTYFHRMVQGQREDHPGTASSDDPMR